jgi:hypothetical protein
MLASEWTRTIRKTMDEDENSTDHNATKTCRICLVERDIEAFHFAPTMRDRRDSRCGRCVRLSKRGKRRTPPTEPLTHPNVAVHERVSFVNGNNKHITMIVQRLTIMAGEVYAVGLTSDGERRVRAGTLPAR